MDLCQAGRWPLLDPLPVTRFLGESFGISNVSAFRVLNGLSDSGHLWQAANGRYFLPEARRLLEKPAPVACLIRRLERWTQVSREIMLGVDDACGEFERAMLLVHDRGLFRQADPTALTSAGTDREIRQSMEDFLLVHSGRIGGVVLDELWPERVLAGFKSRIQRGVILYRSTKLPFLGCVSADVDGAARIVGEHAGQNGFEKLVILLPFRGYQPSDEMAQALQGAVKARFGKPAVVLLDSPGPALQGLLAKLRRQRQRTLLVTTEDNAGVAVLDALRKGGIEVPRRVGLMTTMGSRIARDRSITAAGFDFRLMGAEAARMAVQGPLRHLTLPAAFFPGSTT
jgi:DNA-binding LacI/PurR family transcriptional regulator